MALFLFYNILFLIIFSSFIIFFYKTVKLAKSKQSPEGVNNSKLLILIVAIFIIFYIIYSLILGFPFFPFPFDVFILIWIGMISSSQIIYKKLFKKEEYPTNSYTKNEEFTIKLESKRKATHMVILLLIAVYFGLGYLVYDLIDLGIQTVESVNFNIWGIPSLTFPRTHSTWFIATFGAIGATLLFLIPELFRLFFPEDFMLKKAALLMREGEKHNVSAAIQLSIASSLLLLILPDIGISMSAITISVIGDAFASLFGRKFHNHEISINPSKSYEGTLGGMSCGFISGVIILIFSIDIFSTLILAAVGTLSLGAIDIVNIKVSDNLLNPIIVGFSMYFISLGLFFIL